MIVIAPIKSCSGRETLIPVLNDFWHMYHLPWDFYF